MGGGAYIYIIVPKRFFMQRVWPASCSAQRGSILMRFSVLSVVADPARPSSSAPGSAKSSDSGQSGDIFAAMVDAESHDDTTLRTQPATAAQMSGTPTDALIPASLFSQVVAEATATDKPDNSGDADTDNAGDGVPMQAFGEAAPTVPQATQPPVIAPLAAAPPSAFAAPDAPVETGESTSAIAQALSASRAQARSVSLDDAASAFGTGTDPVDARGNAEALQGDAKSSATGSDMTAKTAAAQADAAAASLLSSADTELAESKAKTTNAPAEGQAPNGNTGSAVGSAAKSGIAEPATGTDAVTASANSSRAAADTDAVSAPGDGNVKETGLNSARAKANAEADAATTSRAGSADAAANASTSTSATPASASDVDPSTTFSILHASAQFASAIQTNAQMPTFATGERLQASGLVPVASIAVEIASRASAGSNRFEIRLDPPELGRIDVRLDVDRTGQVTSHLTVERADTLDLLRRDASQLQRALQDAGLKTGDSALQFSLRDQSFGNNNPNDGMPRRDTAQILIQADEAPAADAANRGLGRLLGSSNGLDIRV
jgi:flagellar hook-length control protein FliK